MRRDPSCEREVLVPQAIHSSSLPAVCITHLFAKVFRCSGLRPQALVNEWSTISSSVPVIPHHYPPLRDLRRSRSLVVHSTRPDTYALWVRFYLHRTLGPWKLAVEPDRCGSALDSTHKLCLLTPSQPEAARQISWLRFRAWGLSQSGSVVLPTFAFVMPQLHSCG